MFKAGVSNEFTFDTGVLKGKLRAGGASKGLTEVIHTPTGTRLDSGMGLFGFYRILGENKRYGDAAWAWPSQAKLGEDGSVSVTWDSTDDRPFELLAVYRWAAPDTLDLETSVVPSAALKKFEVFVATYCSAGFTNASVWALAKGPASSTAAYLLRALPENGQWQAFPRDDAAFALMQDGRWTYPPFPIDWRRNANFVRPLAFRRDIADDLALLVMADPTNCFAVLTPNERDNHRSLYLSLFGRDAAALQTLQARTRLVINTNLSDAAILGRFRAFHEKPAR